MDGNKRAEDMKLFVDVQSHNKAKRSHIETCIIKSKYINHSQSGIEVSFLIFNYKFLSAEINDLYQQ